MTPSHDSTINWDPVGVTIEWRLLTQAYNSTWNFDPGLQFNVEFWPGVAIFNVEFWQIHLSFTVIIATQHGVKIQQFASNSTAKEGYYTTKSPLNIDPIFPRQGWIMLRYYNPCLSRCTIHGLTHIFWLVFTPPTQANCNQRSRYTVTHILRTADWVWIETKIVMSNGFGCI